MRLQAKPAFRAGGAVRFKSFFAAARAVRAIAQAGLYPVELPHPRSGRGLQHRRRRRLRRDPGARLRIGRPSARCLDETRARMLRRSWRRGRDRRRRTPISRAPRASGATPSSACPMRASSSRRRGSSTTLSRPRSPGSASRASTTRSRPRRSARFARRRALPGEVTCRFTHVYPDGPAPYFSFHALGRHGALLEQWRAIKDAASDALIAAGGTITHHHAVGRDHRPWYDRQRPELFAAALRAAKRALDPAGDDESRRADRAVRMVAIHTPLTILRGLGPRPDAKGGAHLEVPLIRRSPRRAAPSPARGEGSLPRFRLASRMKFGPHLRQLARF